MLRNPLWAILGIVVLLAWPLVSDADDKTKPATLAEIRDCIDWAKVPLLEGAKPGRTGLSSCRYTAPGTFAEAITFYRKHLPTLGWIEDATPIPGFDQKAYLYLVFNKGAMQLAINGFRAAPADPMSITLTIWGNVDCRVFAKPADAKVMTDRMTAVVYTTGAKPEDAAAFCRKAVLDRGWNEVIADSAKFHAKEGRTILRFLEGAMEIGVTIFKNVEGVTELTFISHVRFAFEPRDVREAMTAKEIPEPATLKDYLAVLDLRKFPLMKDARKRDRQSRAIAISNSISYQVSGTMEEALRFQRKEFLDKGWKEIAIDNDIDHRIEVLFEKRGYLVTVDIGQQEKQDVQVAVTNHGNVDLRQLPYPPGAEIGSERTTFLNIRTTLSPADTEEFYRKEMENLGWKKTESRGRGSIEFYKAASTLRIDIHARPEGATLVKVTSALLAVE